MWKAIIGRTHGRNRRCQRKAQQIKWWDCKSTQRSSQSRKFHNLEHVIWLGFDKVVTMKVQKTEIAKQTQASFHKRINIFVQSGAVYNGPQKEIRWALPSSSSWEFLGTPPSRHPAPRFFRLLLAKASDQQPASQPANYWNLTNTMESVRSHKIKKSKTKSEIRETPRNSSQLGSSTDFCKGRISLAARVKHLTGQPANSYKNDDIAIWEDAWIHWVMMK